MYNLPLSCIVSGSILNSTWSLRYDCSLVASQIYNPASLIFKFAKIIVVVVLLVKTVTLSVSISIPSFLHLNSAGGMPCSVMLHVNVICDPIIAT